MGLTVNGKATIFGVAGTATYGTIVYQLTGNNLSEDTPYGSLETGIGNTTSESYGDPKHTLEIDFTPISTTGNSMADALTLTKLPAAGSIVAIAATGLPLHDGNWNYSGKGKITPAQGPNPLKMTLTLTRNGPPTGGIPTALTAASA